MNRFLFKNDTAENITASISVTPSDELGNLGHTAATIIEENKLTTCLAPTVITLPEPTKYRSDCFELSDDGLYAVEINGVVQPYAFTPTDLLDAFNGMHESKIKFRECVEDACLNATTGAITGGVWGGAIYTINGVDYPSYYNDFAELIEVDDGSETVFYWKNLTDQFLRVEIRNAELYKNDDGWVENTNPTLKYDADAGTVKFCLAPAVPKLSISCDGATDSARLTDGSGTWNIELNGKLYVSPDGYGLGYFIHRTPELKAEIEAGGDGDFQLYNLSTTKHQRIRIIPVDGSSWEIHPGNNNPTVAVNDDGSISLCLAPTRPEIVCDGATSSFQAKSSLATNEIEVSIDYGPWKSIYDTTEISATYLPGNPGADIRFSLIDEGARKVRVRTTRDIGLYVNPSIGFDQINDNKAYTLYDRDGNIIDPFDPKNQDHSGREFDDTGTTDDFAVFFAEAEFCLATEPSPTYAIRLEGESSLKEMFENNISSEKHRDTKVVELEFYEGLEIISMQAFSDCSISGELTFSDSVWLIGQNAFLRNNISEITLGSGIKRLGNYAFRDNKITTIHIYATTPPEIESESWPPFEGNVIENIYVPTSVVDAYKSAPYWSTFADKIFGF